VRSQVTWAAGSPWTIASNPLNGSQVPVSMLLRLIA